MSPWAIDVTGLRKTFGSLVAVDDVSVRIPRGQIWGFLGANGSGKTTTLRMLCGLLQPTAGEGSCLGFDILRESKRIKQRTGYMTQKFSFWEDLSIRENLEFVARLYGLSPVAGVVDETLHRLGLADRQKQLAGHLSGGWKQRMALAAVTMHHPELLLLDEPTAGVDPKARREFWDRIHQLSDQGLTVLVSTHYMDEAERCDKVVYLSRGRMMVQGTVAEIVQSTGLKTFRAEGPEVRRLAGRLKHMPGIEHVAFFGAALHVSGRDDDLLRRSLAQVDGSVVWQPVPTSLEDAFIALMERAEEPA